MTSPASVASTGRGFGFHRKRVMDVQGASMSIEDLVARHAGQSGALIPLLQEVQERYGYLRASHIEEVAGSLRLSPSEVYEVLTFYAQFRLIPPGRTTVKVCQGTACHVRGGKRILQELETLLNVRAGSTSEDFEYSLEKIACFGACSLAPVVVVGKQVYGRLTPQKVKKIFFNQPEAKRPGVTALQPEDLGLEGLDLPEDGDPSRKTSSPPPIDF